MSELFAPVYAVAPTRRRRFFWAAWWSAPPSREPFRRPDAAAGGARTRDEARASAEKAAGTTLIEIDPGWARAAGRVLVGEAPWTSQDAAKTAAFSARSPRPPAAMSIWQQLQIEPHATVDEIKRAYRRRALETHPDRGGEAEAFRQVQRAYEEALRRRARKAAPRPRPGTQRSSG